MNDHTNEQAAKQVRMHGIYSTASIWCAYFFGALLAGLFTGTTTTSQSTNIILLVAFGLIIAASEACRVMHIKRTHKG